MGFFHCDLHSTPFHSFPCPQEDHFCGEGGEGERRKSKFSTAERTHKKSRSEREEEESLCILLTPSVCVREKRRKNKRSENGWFSVSLVLLPLLVVAIWTGRSDDDSSVDLGPGTLAAGLRR